MTFSKIYHSASRGQPPSAFPSFEATFSYGFRPFFLGSAIYAALVMILWIAWITTNAAGLPDGWLPVARPIIAWHAHEMVFGFAVAAIGGFLLTAVPNWTGALPLSGLPLVVLFTAWLIGRVAMSFSALIPYPLAAGLELAFLPMLGAVATRQLLMRPAPRNLVFLVLVAALTLCNVLFHLGNAGYLAIGPLDAIRASVLVVVIMIAIVGGRIIPAFTNNWLQMKKPSSGVPQRLPKLDAMALASITVFALLEVIHAPDNLLGAVALMAALANGARLWLWRGLATRSEPIVWVLHLGYAWIVAGLALSALAAFTAVMPSVIVAHAFGTGAVGTMIMAVMSRASLGHTGRPLIAPSAIVWAFHLVTCAAVLRIAGPFFAPPYDVGLVVVAGFAWSAAFVLFAIVYAPILTTPRVHIKSVRG